MENRRDRLQEEIAATLKNWVPDGVLDDYTRKFENARNAESVAENLLRAFAEGTLHLEDSDTKLPPAILARDSGARFLPKQSIIECEIDGETRSGIVYGDEYEVRKWLTGEDVIAGVFDTPEKRMQKCAALYEGRLNEPATSNCSKEEHFNAIQAVIQGLLQQEFESVRTALGSKYPRIHKPGRRPKPRLEA